MTFSLFINFDGACKEALAFYQKVFKTEAQGVTTYSDLPPDPDYTVPEADKDRIVFSSMVIYGCNIMFCDVPTGMKFVKGNNISPNLGTEDEGEVRRIFAMMEEEGDVDMPLQETFWSGLYGMVTDKFGITWQLSKDGDEPLDM